MLNTRMQDYKPLQSSRTNSFLGLTANNRSRFTAIILMAAYSYFSNKRLEVVIDSFLPNRCSEQFYKVYNSPFASKFAGSGYPLTWIFIPNFLVC